MTTEQVPDRAIERAMVTKHAKPYAYCCTQAGGDPATCDCVVKDHGTAIFHAVCSIPNCRNRAPADEAFCSAHRKDHP